VPMGWWTITTWLVMGRLCAACLPFA